MRKLLVCFSGILLLACIYANAATDEDVAQLSAETQMCISCHETITPGIVADWRKSRHAHTTLSSALLKPELERRVSVENPPDNITDVVIGCAECHNTDPEAHRDTFQHYGFNVHTVVTPNDCMICHPVEVEQYGHNLMSNAYGNLVNNSLYRDLMDTINGTQHFDGSSTLLVPPSSTTEADSCLYCHGTVIEVDGTEMRDTSMGPVEFPVLSGWPNQGVGRINPDGSKGSCASCHARHRFSIEMARKPYTCAECHKGPDVPAYKVYTVSKHGNIFSTHQSEWDFNAVPWKVGEDFTAPTCATCHVSLITDNSGNVVAERTHGMNNRSPWRLLGVIYAHPHPVSPDVSGIVNSAGLPLPTELTGEPVSEYLINTDEQLIRRQAMQDVCLACHSTGWVENHFERLDETIETTNDMTLTATNILIAAWEKGAAKGLSEGDSIFNEAIEKMWVEQWLFYANSVRFASAMAGADLGVYENGRWQMSKNIQDMVDHLELKSAVINDREDE